MLGILFGSMMVGIAVAIIVAVYLLLALGYYKMFQKAGEPGWKAFIPVYNWYIYTKLTWKPSMFGVMFVLEIVCELTNYFEKSNASVALAVASAIVGIVFIVFQAISASKASKAYGHGGGYAVGLFFLPYLFTLIIGFGKSEYKGA